MSGPIVLPIPTDDLCETPVATIRQHVETDLPDDAIERLIRDACAAINDRAGSITSRTVFVEGEGRFLLLPYPLADIADIVAVSELSGTTAPVVLDAVDWRWRGGRMLERLGTGTHPGTGVWRGTTSVEYTRSPDAERRLRVLIDCVRLAIQYNALSSERAGDYSSSSLPDYQAERDKIIGELVPKMEFA